MGPNGRVYTADIHPLAIDLVKRKIDRYRLANVTPVLLGDKPGTIPDRSADVVYALDMFHQVDDPAAFLDGIHRIVKPEGGHQPRSQSLEKVQRSRHWRVARENEHWMELKPAA